MSNFYIQVINKNYKFSANNNVLRYDVQQAVRGLIYDRNNRLIVANVPAYDLMIIPRELINKTIDTLYLCNLLNISKDEYLNTNLLLTIQNIKKMYLSNILILKHVTTLSEKLFQFPYFYLRKLTMRNYPTNIATHVIGYLGSKYKQNN